jgi:hypothetical protein
MSEYTTPGSVSRQVVRESGNASSGPIRRKLQKDTEPDKEINRTLSDSNIGVANRISQDVLNNYLAELFATVDRNGDGNLSLAEAESLMLRLNSRLGRNYGEDQANAFFRALDLNNDGVISFDEFKSAVLRLF